MEPSTRLSVKERGRLLYFERGSALFSSPSMLNSYVFGKGQDR